MDKKKKIMLWMRTMGEIPVDMGRFLLFLNIPDNVELTYKFTNGLPHCLAINEIIKSAVANDIDYTRFLDEDNIPEDRDCLKTLLEADKKTISWLVPSRTPMQWFHTLCVFDEKQDDQGKIGVDQYLNIPEWDDIFEIKACWFGCVLVHRDVFKKVCQTFHNFPTEMRTMRYYMIEWTPMSEEEIDYKHIKIPEWTVRYNKYVSEDMIFFERARRLTGVKMYAHKWVKCNHIGLNKIVNIEEDIEKANKKLPLFLSQRKKW